MCSSEPGTEATLFALRYFNDGDRRRMVLWETWGDGKLMDEHLLGGFTSPGTFFLADAMLLEISEGGK